jgi:uncharacterized protein (UPF0332 family)
LNADTLLQKANIALVSAKLQLVRTGVIDIELGKALNKVEDLRLIGDYKADVISLEQASWAVQQAT